MEFAYIFPGQGSQSIGMMENLSTRYPEVRQTFEQGSDTLQQDLWKLVSSGPESELNLTEITQPVMLCACVAVYRIFHAHFSDTPLLTAGHSFGEYSALTCAGALKFEAALFLARYRGHVMQQAVPEGQGAMAAVLGLEARVLDELCKQSSQEREIVEAVNFNAPGQTVVAGSQGAVSRVLEAARQAGAKRSVLLPLSVPSHSTLMKPAAEKLRTYLHSVAVTPPRVAVVQNADVQVCDSEADIKDALCRQLFSPVRWVETVEYMIAKGVKALVELGPGKVLTSFSKRIDRTVPSYCISDLKSLDQTLEQLNAMSTMELA